VIHLIDTPDAAASPAAGKVLTPNLASTAFWADFLRVQSDKIIMLVLIAFLFHVHADEKLVDVAVGGLIMLIQGQRFKF
jgi:hypothetical protein